MGIDIVGYALGGICCVKLLAVVCQQILSTGILDNLHHSKFGFTLVQDFTHGMLTSFRGDCSTEKRNIQFGGGGFGGLDSRGIPGQGDCRGF